VSLDDCYAVGLGEKLVGKKNRSDPQEYPGRSPSKRGVGIQFGPDVTERFLQENNLLYVIRSINQMKKAKENKILFLEAMK